MQSIWPSLVVFLLVLAAIPVAGWLLRRSPILSAQTGGVLGVGASIAVGTRERIVLVRAGSRWVLVGVTPQSISLLSEFSEAPQIPETPADAPSREPARTATPGLRGSSPFSDLLRRGAGIRGN